MNFSLTSIPLPCDSKGHFLVYVLKNFLKIYWCIIDDIQKNSHICCIQFDGFGHMHTLMKLCFVLNNHDNLILLASNWFRNIHRYNPGHWKIRVNSQKAYFYIYSLIKSREEWARGRDSFLFFPPFSCWTFSCLNVISEQLWPSCDWVWGSFWKVAE